MIRIATFNILHGRPWPGRHRFRSRLYRDAIAALDVDILGLQEVDRRVVRTCFVDQAELAADALGAAAPVFAGAQWLGPGGRMGNALCVRGSIADVEIVWHPTALGHEHRNTIVARVTVRSQSLSVGVTHLQNFRDEAHAGLARTIRALAERPEPRVLMGDLNLPTEECHDTLTSAGYTLLDTYGSNGRVVTHDGAPRIDHIAVQGIGGREVAVPKPPISDHAPIVAELG